eukprot:CAMPEP_0194055834 /NCGR_PEP_ID=MMETSP0009_2-20130614/58072_1 /TAXON_ID=210454 /ORGANISM="Grammatophora oceanica, Strain CCMP 410" /LENGTH=60 /DNA_ID=CAMNT_0038704909 /DNA_START=12 /DNA_END=190 /DNA_ORIENTATION=-
MKGICRQYPLGVGTIIDWPLEIEDYRSDDMLEEGDDNEEDEDQDEVVGEEEDDQQVPETT